MVIMVNNLLKNKVLVCAVFLLSLIVNFIASSTTLIGGITTAEVSNTFKTLITPAGITFVIWGVIYLLLIVYCIKQFRLKNDLEKEMVDQINPYFIMLSLANIAWLFMWQFKLFLLSIFVILIMLFSLIKIFRIVTKSKLTKTGYLSIRLPFSIYFGWVTVATIEDIAVTLVSYNWGGWGIDPAVWTLVILSVATIICLVASLTYSDIAYMLVFLWAYVGIMINQTSKTGFNSNYPDIVTFLIVNIVIFAVGVVYLVVKKIINERKTLIS